MTQQPSRKADPLDSFDYCIQFWDGALDAEEEIDRCVRETSPRKVPADDAAQPEKGITT